MDNDELMGDEGDAWHVFGAVIGLLPAALDSQLAKDSDMTCFDYYVLHFLQETPEQTMRMSALAACANSTLPRMSKVASRLEGQGLVTRTPAAGDGRAVNVVLTEAGSRHLAEATPGHLRTVRSLVFDVLTAEQVVQLRDISQAIVSRLHPDAETPIDRQPSTALA